MDRHARVPHGRPDLRRRPPDGFRLASRARFARLAALAVHSLPGAVGRAARTAELVVRDVPESGEGVVLAEFEPQRRGPSRLTVYRRPFELRSESKVELVDLLREAVATEIDDVLGLDGAE